MNAPVVVLCCVPRKGIAAFNPRILINIAHLNKKIARIILAIFAFIKRISDKLHVSFQPFFHISQNFFTVDVDEGLVIAAGIEEKSLIFIGDLFKEAFRANG